MSDRTPEDPTFAIGDRIVRHGKPGTVNRLDGPHGTVGFILDGESDEWFVHPRFLQSPPGGIGRV